MPDAAVSCGARGLLPHDFTLTGGVKPPAVWFLWHFPGPFGPPGFPRRPPLWSPDFPRAPFISTGARGRPARLSHKPP